MKKTILLFLFVLPVIIVILIVAIVGFVGRRVMFIEIQSVSINYEIFNYSPNFTERFSPNPNDLILSAEVGEVFEFTRYIVVEPLEAARQLVFESSNPQAVQVIDGRIHILQNARMTDSEEGIELAVMHGVRLFTVLVRIDIDDDSFDYFGFDEDLFIRGADTDWADTYGVFLNHDAVLEIDRSYILSELNNTIPIGWILERGFNTAPRNLLYLANPRRNQFLDSLQFESSNTQILSISSVEGYGQFNALIYNGQIAENGVALTITIRSNFMYSNFETTVQVLVM